MPSLRRTNKIINRHTRFPILLSFSETTAPGSVLIRQATAGASKGILASRQLQGVSSKPCCLSFCCRCRYKDSAPAEWANNEAYIYITLPASSFLSKIIRSLLGQGPNQNRFFPTHGKNVIQVFLPLRSVSASSIRQQHFSIVSPAQSQFRIKLYIFPR